MVFVGLYLAEGTCKTLMRKLVVLAMLIKRAFSTKSYQVPIYATLVCAWIFLITINSLISGHDH